MEKTKPPKKTEIPFWEKRYKPIRANRDRNEVIRELYLNNDKIQAEHCRKQTGEGASFMSKVALMRDEYK